jgi:platelet-activating factor acetylhydrolase
MKIHLSSRVTLPDSMLIAQMPVTPFAPLVSPPTTNSTITAKHPLVIFSHGLAGTRNTYSQYCSALASRGYVVLAIEHRDGSGPAVSIPDSVDSSSTSTGIGTTAGTDGKEQSGKLRTRLYTKTEDLE